ncbi:RagB/SusD family nutrient uptake outer membrane protein [[Flexibacter] sp. ATCC 35208]|uniref:RagB/SusD family nutrient uptake outer membrane protein n=1 Tax=[Flexibacter] sp. ATCC 35208 TaxID=1936242 RepID=UPI0009C4D02C|nr:RagB/SusD family nutrient uptake outer membrane protein [[Flexibacter] sp. ATCC 35208]OMP80054.1 hypothetical protein BW716_06055 [[Flexibacter] sp. ATCC 35208]
MKCINKYILLVLLFALFQSCKKFLHVKTPEGQLTDNIIFSSDSLATNALIGIYTNLVSNSISFPSGVWSISLLAGLSADELDNYSASQIQAQYYLNDISPTNSINKLMWQQFYRSIYQCNTVMEGIVNSKNISSSVKGQLLGEALFLRAYCFFYLINMYGPVPLSLTTRYQENDTLYRSAIDIVYNQIENDLNKASQSLSDEYPSGSERIRANRSAANALLSRIYLYTGNWRQCIEKSSVVINRKDQYQLCSSLRDVFLKNSKEAILQLQPILPRYNTFDAPVFILQNAPRNVACSRQLISSFEPNDLRMINWIGIIKVDNDSFYFPYKYKMLPDSTVGEYLMILRLSELYLSRSEAYARLGIFDSAWADLNIVRQRSGLLPLSSNSANILGTIFQERRVELFTEWGNRWFDLKRIGNANLVLGSIKGSLWQPTDVLYPIPISEIVLNPRLTQNPGY